MSDESKIDRDRFKQIGRLQKEELRLDALSNQGYRTTTDLFYEYIERYQHNNPGHKIIFSKLKELLFNITIKLSKEMKKKKIGFNGKYFPEQV